MATGKDSKKSNKLHNMFNKNQQQTTRRSEIVEQSHYVVKMFIGDTLVEERPIIGHSTSYAEDCAENWDNGIIDLSN